MRVSAGEDSHDTCAAKLELSRLALHRGGISWIFPADFAMRSGYRTAELPCREPGRITMSHLLPLCFVVAWSGEARPAPGDDWGPVARELRVELDDGQTSAESLMR